jgi:hypothetical protein
MGIGDIGGGSIRSNGDGGSCSGGSVLGVAVAVAVAAVVVTAGWVESRVVEVVVVAKNTSKSMALLSTAAFVLIDVNGMLVVGYG